MTVRITFFTIIALLYFRVEGLAQVAAQDRTQQFFDNNKGADVINPNRTLTDRIGQPHELTHKSALPHLTPIPDAKRAPKRKVSTKQNQVKASPKQAGQQTEKQKKFRQTESRSARESFLPPLTK